MKRHRPVQLSFISHTLTQSRVCVICDAAVSLIHDSVKNTVDTAHDIALTAEISVQIDSAPRYRCFHRQSCASRPGAGNGIRYRFPLFFRKLRRLRRIIRSKRMIFFDKDLRLRQAELIDALLDIAYHIDIISPADLLNQRLLQDAAVLVFIDKNDPEMFSDI